MAEPLDLAEIRRALDAATPADEWRFDGRVGFWRGAGHEQLQGGPALADAALIANAPTWLAALLDRVERLERALLVAAGLTTERREPRP